VESSSSGVFGKKVGKAESCDFSSDTANFRQNSDRQLWIYDTDDFWWSKYFNFVTKFYQNGFFCTK